MNDESPSSTVRRVCLRCGVRATHVFHASRVAAEAEETWKRYWFPHDRSRFVCMKCWAGEQRRLLEAGFAVDDPIPLAE